MPPAREEGIEARVERCCNMVVSALSHARARVRRSSGSDKISSSRTFSFRGPGFCFAMRNKRVASICFSFPALIGCHKWARRAAKAVSAATPRRCKADCFGTYASNSVLNPGTRSTLTLVTRCQARVGPSAISAIVVLTNALIGHVVTSLTTRRRLVKLMATSSRSVRFIRSSYMKNRNW